MSNEQKQGSHTHFEGKEAVHHMAEKRAKGIIASAEVHGTEIPGHISAGADAMRETGVVLLVLWIFLGQHPQIMGILSIFSISWLFWKGGRSGWLGWSRLERMHRIVEQEKWEIVHHRGQEREELKELYSAKGFEGKLLDEVVEVLMADEDRLLRVMVEEELCLSLESQEHPLRQGIGAALGVFCAGIACLLSHIISPKYGMWFGSIVVVGLGAGITAYYEKNRVIPAIVWNLGLLTVASGFSYFLLEYLP